MIGRTVRFLTVAMGAGLLGMMPTAPVRADTVLTMNVVMPRASSFFLGVYQPWKEAVERESNGRIHVEMPAASMAPLPRQWEMVTSGIADVALTPNDYLRERVKLPFLAEIPFIAPNSVAASVAIWRTQEKFFTQANEYKGAKLLGMWVNGGNTLQTVKRPVLKIEDFKGLKLWVATPNMKDAIQALGATPVSAQAANSMFDYMSGGIVDGAVTGKGSIISFQLGRYTKEMTMFAGQLGYNSFTFFMNEKKYNSLSAEDRAIIDKVSYENLAWFASQGFIDQDNLADPVIAQNGINVHQADAEFMKQAEAKTAFFKDRWFEAAKEKKIDAQAAWDFYVNTAQEIAKNPKR